MSTTRKLAVIAAGVLVLVVAFVVLGSGGNDSPSKSTSSAAGTPAATSSQGPAAVPTIRFAKGKPVGGVQKLSFAEGDEVRFKVASDVADEIHVHGFDKMQDVKAGGTVAFDFPAKFDGQYVVEMEGSSTQIASLEIQP